MRKQENTSQHKRRRKMNPSRKQLMAQIDHVEKKLTRYQNQAKIDESYLFNTFNRAPIALLMALFPAFLMGWSSARVKHIDSFIKRFLRFGVLTSITLFRKKIGFF